MDELDLVPVLTVEQAQEQRFLGSPTVRVDGRDVEPAVEVRSDYGMKCRLYSTSAGSAHAPANELIVAALDRAD